MWRLRDDNGLQLKPAIIASDAAGRPLGTDRGASLQDGVAVLDDSRRPDELHLAGRWRLSDELRAAGTVPQVAANRRTCSIKYKGWPIDTWLDGELTGRSFRHIMGFNADEEGRAERDASYSTVTRSSEYPLIGWGWGRATCEDYIEGLVGEPWVKSYCTFCPFAGNRAGLPGHLARWAEHPDAAVDALILEHTSLALNPNIALFGSRSARSAAEAAGTPVLAQLNAALTRHPHALYLVRRIFHPAGGDPARKGPAWRSVRRLASGTLARMEGELRRTAGAVVDGRVDVARTVSGALAATLRARGDSYPTVEELVVVAPAVVEDKQRPRFDEWWGFDEWWARLTGEGNLFAA